MEDKIIICRNCGKEFKFTAGEQKFYEEKGLAAPVRCKECRAARKAAQAVPEKTQEQKMADFEDMLAKFQANTIPIEQPKKRRR